MVLAMHARLVLLTFLDAFEVQSQQIESGQYSQSLVILTAGTPSWSHAGDNAIWPFNGNMDGANGLPLLFFRTRNAGNTQTIIRFKTLTYSMRHSSCRFLADDSI